MKIETIEGIVDLIWEYGKLHVTHPNDSVKLFAASRLVDNEIMRRLAILNERNKNDAKIFVGHCGSDNGNMVDVGNSEQTGNDCSS